MKIDITRDCPIIETPRVTQVCGIFDVAPAEISKISIQGELPIETRDWSVGLIVGPSGSGKTTVARDLFGDRLVSGFAWPADKSILDGFPAGMSIKTITGLLNAVGFGSVPNWFRPYGVLSNGEQFRVTMARALAEKDDLVAIDEFTSVVDRQVAKIASHCVQKAVRRDRRKFIAVACHYDIVEWLQPDWVYEPHLGAFEWRSLQRRPEIALEIRSVSKDLWARFSKYHYLTSHLSSSAFCLGGFIEDICVGFTSAIHFPHPQARNIYAEHRTVVLPDYQGLGMSGVMSEWMGRHLWERGWRLHTVASHPAIIAQKAASPRWRLLRHGLQTGGGSSNFASHQDKFSSRRLSASFVYSAPEGTPSPMVPQRSGPLLSKRIAGSSVGAQAAGADAGLQAGAQA